ncbi:MAG TPA: PfkB family carbohydrate kinase [Ktedonobacterales bacterium]|jgi:D-beta-D-heptose 7-phosphate kinase/D-beta-D-heptose 1-phosphate adenosyltransferase|nr:PfkB family carbohydrate kinase [Ktedonobacterales bacterium]
MANAVERVRRFRHLRVLVIGDAILDTYLLGAAERLCVEGPVPVVRKQSERRVPGGAANTASNLRALGASVTYLGLIGRDAAGAMLRDMIQRQGIEDRWLLEDDAVTTQHKLRIIADGQYVVRFDEGATNTPAMSTRCRLREGVESELARCDVVVISDYCYGALDDALIAHVKAQREQRDAPLVVDSKQLARFRTARASVVTPNLAEARALVEAHGSLAAPLTRGDDPKARVAEGERLAEALLEILDTQIAAVTMAADGVALAARDGRRWRIPAYPIARPNDVGAGDSFTSALALALAAGAAPDEAARIGVDAASIAVSKRFTSLVEHRELLQRVSLRESASDERARFWTGSPATRRNALQNIQARLDLERAAGRTVVFTNGVFDVLHAGHIAYLRQAKALGDTLVVGVNSDTSVERLSGARPSRMTSERDRLALIAALEVVDYAVLFDEETPARLIRALRPHIHVKGGDYADEALPESEAVREVGGRVVIVPLAGDAVAEEPGRIVSLAPGAPESDGDHAYAG